ncbi:MAG: SGNH/GDSL hydrolase family protein [Cyclobacteriaceae bacterium]|nr:SGNH/GDSL hydrolase family protein [Cyclobacteriaceae bacterium]
MEIKGDKSLGLVFAFIALLSGVMLLLSLFIHPAVLVAFASDGEIDAANVARIYATRRLFWAVGGSMLLLSLVAMRMRFSKWQISPERPVLLITLIWSLTVVELLLRINPRYTTLDVQRASPAYLPSPVSQHRLDPNDQFIVSGSTKDTIRILSGGFSTSRFRAPKRAGEIRFFVMGGSHVFDLNAPLGLDWPSRAEKNLHAEGYSHISIINAGVPGWRTFDMIGRIMAEVHYYEPDYIILCQTYNDLKYFSWAGPDSTPFHTLPKLGHPTHPHVSFWIRTLEQFQIYLYIRDALLNSRTQPQLAQDQDYTYQPDEAEDIQQAALDQFRLNIQVFLATCQAAGIHPILATEPRLLTPNNLDEITASGRFSTSTGLSLSALLQATQKCDSVLSSEADRFSTPFFDLSSACSGRMEAFRDLIHYNREGGVCAASRLAAEIKELLQERIATQGRPSQSDSQ